MGVVVSWGLPRGFPLRAEFSAADRLVWHNPRWDGAVVQAAMIGRRHGGTANAGIGQIVCALIEMMFSVGARAICNGVVASI